MPLMIDFRTFITMDGAHKEDYVAYKRYVAVEFIAMSGSQVGSQHSSAQQLWLGKRILVTASSFGAPKLCPI